MCNSNRNYYTGRKVTILGNNSQTRGVTATIIDQVDDCHYKVKMHSGPYITNVVHVDDISLFVFE